MVRFVDRDMFMHYRGSGIGHTYMQEIEEIYKNMSHEWIHHKEGKHASSTNDPAGTDSINGNSSDDECATNEPTNTQAAGDGDNNSDSALDLDYNPSGMDSEGSGSSKKSYTHNVDLEDDGFESYRFGDL